MHSELIITHSILNCMQLQADSATYACTYSVVINPINRSGTDMALYDGSLDAFVRLSCFNRFLPFLLLLSYWFRDAQNVVSCSFPLLISEFVQLRPCRSIESGHTRLEGCDGGRIERVDEGFNQLE